MEDLILKERERIIRIVTRVIDRDIEGRILKKMRRRSVQMSRLQRIKGRIIFWINNPNYVRKTSSSSQK